MFVNKCLTCGAPMEAESYICQFCGTEMKGAPPRPAEILAGGAVEPTVWLPIINKDWVNCQDRVPDSKSIFTRCSEYVLTTALANSRRYIVDAQGNHNDMYAFQMCSSYYDHHKKDWFNPYVFGNKNNYHVSLWMPLPLKDDERWIDAGIQSPPPGNNSRNPLISIPVLVCNKKTNYDESVTCATFASGVNMWFPDTRQEGVSFVPTHWMQLPPPPYG